MTYDEELDEWISEIINGSLLIMGENGNRKMGMSPLNELICAQTAMDALFKLLVQKEKTQKASVFP